MTDLEHRTHINIGAHVLSLEANIEDKGSTVPAGGLTLGSDSPYDIEEVPNAFLALPLTDDVWFGLGFNAPFGLKNEYDRNWFGRYDSTKTDLQTLNYSAVLAYKINDKWSVGGGLDLQSADASLESTVFWVAQNVVRN